MSRRDPKTEGAADHRAGRRVHVLLQAVLERDGEVWTAHLRNLSCTGALVDCDASFDAGTQLTFRRGPAERRATVVWARSDRLGLSFDRPFSEGEVAALTRRL